MKHPLASQDPLGADSQCGKRFMLVASTSIHHAKNAHTLKTSCQRFSLKVCRFYAQTKF